MNLMDYLPEEYLRSKEVNTIQTALQPEIDRVWQGRSDLLLQLDPRTATWGLALWETAFGLTVDTAKNIDYRRTRVIAKIRGNGTTTAELIKEIASSFTNGDVEIIEYPEEYRFEVKFTGTVGTPPNIDDLTASIDEIKPAHLSYTYNITFATWGYLAATTWGNLAARTWFEVKESGY